MNRLVIIGNGFDLAHDLKTSYKNFIDWYWGQRTRSLLTCDSRVSEDVLCKFEINKNYFFIEDWYIYSLNHNCFRDDHFKTMDAYSILSIIENDESCNVERSILLERITQNIENKGWVDIESDYYELIKANADNIETCKSINKQMDYLREQLTVYLKEVSDPEPDEAISKAFHDNIFREDLETSAQYSRTKDSGEVKTSKKCPPRNTLLLSFNYTPTAEMYLEESIRVNYIHGSLGNPKEMIFGYGDEMDKDFKDLENRNENALLENSKSIKYLETSHYRDLLSFIEGGPFQVYIMGHSCGNSDRTLLNTIFEHQNCISIKPFCYINDKGEDNYSELTRNIYRNFTDKKLFRDRVVNKERCTTLDGHKLGCQTQAETH